MDKRICVYPAGEADFASNGMGCLSPTSCKVHWTMDGEYEAEIEHPLDQWGKYERLCACGRTVVMPVPEAPSMALRQTGTTTTVQLYAIATRKSRLRLRSGPGTGYRCLGYYAKGKRVTLLKKTNADWYEVTAPDGRHGWMSARYLAAAGTRTVGAVSTEILRDLPMRPQPFDIYAYDPGLSAVTARARHVFYRLAENLVCELEVKDLTAQQALDAAFAAAVDQSHGFHWHCEDTEKRSMDRITGRSLADVILGDGGICETYGLHLLADWFDVFLVKEIGARRGVQLRYAKNVTALSGGYDISDVATRVVPVGQTKDGKPLYRSGNRWVASAHESLYPRAIYRQLDVSEAKVGSEVDGKKLTTATARALMDKRAQELLDGGCGLPDCSLTVKMAQLRYDPAYGDYADLERVCPGDTLGLFLPDYGLTLDTTLSEYTFDALSQRYDDLTMGSPRRNLSSSGVTSRQLGRGSVTGSKLAYGSVGSGALGTGALAERHFQAESINTQALQAQCVTTEKLAAGSVQADQISAGSVTTEKLEAGAVTAEKLAAGSVQADKLQAGSVTTEKLSAEAVTAEKLAAGSVQAKQLSAGSVTAEKLSAGAVTADKLAAGSVTAEKLDAGSVTTDKLAAGAVTAEKIASKTITADLIKAKTITAESGIIDDSAIGTAQIADGSITSAKIVELNADLIKAGTLSAERLLLVGEDGVIYKINAASSGLSLTELQKDQYKNYINGTVIVARSITAAQIAAQSITGNEILAGSITAKEIDVSDLFADEATVSALNAMDIRGNRYLQLYVTDRVDGISVGGRNLYTGTQNFDGDTWKGKGLWTEDGSCKGCLVYKRAGQWSGLGQMIALEANTQYTLSAWLKQTDGGDVRYYDTAASGGVSSDKGGSAVEVGASWSRRHVTFTVSTADTYCPRFEQNGDGHTLWVAGLKLEKGNKPTDWSPAPEDVSSAIEANTAEITLAKNSITSLVSKVDGISIGGRNLLRNTNQGVTNWGWSMQTGGKTVEEYLDGGVRACKMTRDAVEQTGWSVISYDMGANEYALLEPNTEYTLSFDYKPSVTTANGAAFSIRRGDGSNAATNDGGYWKEIPANEWTHVSGTFTTAANLPDFLLNSTEIYITRLPTTANSVHIFKNLKLEKGNKATDWSPAPEDIEARVATAESKIDQTAESITLSVETKINNLSVGGTNLYTGTQNFAGDTWTAKSLWTEDGSYNGCLVYKRAGQWQGLGQMIALEANTQYTLSAWLKQTDGGTVRYYDTKANGASSSDKGGSTVEVGTSWSRCHVTFTVSTADTYCPRFEQNGDGHSLWVAGLKLEKGNKPTDWSPAPKDIADGISVGGRNYILKSDEYDPITGNGGVAQDCYIFEIADSFWLNDGRINSNIAFSFDWEWNTGLPGAMNSLIGFRASPYYNASFQFPAGQKTGHVSLSIDIPTLDYTATHLFIRLVNVSASYSLTIRNAKLEVGNKATDWSPAPEDPAGSLSVSSDYSKVDINTERVRIVSKRMEVAVPSDDGEDDVLRVDADGVHAEVVEADMVVSDSVVGTQGKADYAPANPGELAAILEGLAGKHLTDDVNIDCSSITSGSYTIRNVSGTGRVVLWGASTTVFNSLYIENCGDTIVSLYQIGLSNAEDALTVERSFGVIVSTCVFSARVGIRIGTSISTPGQVIMDSCTGDCTYVASVNYRSVLRCIGSSKPTGGIYLTTGSEVYNATSGPTFAAKADPSIPTTQTVTVSLSPTQTYTLRGTSNSDGNKLYQGRYSASQSLRRGVMLFTLPEDLAGADSIDSATLTIRRIGGVGQGGGVTVQVRCFDVPGTLYASKTAYGGQTVSIDVTAAVRAMKTNGYTGLMLYNPDMATVGSKSYTASYARFAGKGESGAPTLKISYRK